MAKRQAQNLAGDPVDVAFFDEMMNRHLPRVFIHVMRRLPSGPRCRLCRAPYGGVGGRIMRRFGFGPSRKNPNLCNTCFEKAPMGGVEMEIGVLFADVRGYTSLAEQMAPDDVAQMLNRFYAAASKVLTRSAIIDKLVGDEVMALYLPQLLEVDHVEAQQIRFAVIDDGPGIPRDQRERVFERFHRTDASRARLAGGAGLGLAIARAIAEAHGGEVHAREPRNGRGAAVELMLSGFQPRFREVFSDETATATRQSAT